MALLALFACGAPPKPTVTETERPRADAGPPPVTPDAGQADRVDQACVQAAKGQCDAALPVLRGAKQTPRVALALARCTDGGAALDAVRSALADVGTRPDAQARVTEVARAMPTAALPPAVDTYADDTFIVTALRAELVARPDAPPEAARAALGALPADHPAVALAKARSARPRIGVILPLTGRTRRIGARLAEVVPTLGGADLIVRDGGSPAGTRAAVESFVADGVDGMVGLFDRQTAEVAVRALGAHQTPLIMLTLSDAPVRGETSTWRALDTPAIVARTTAGALLARNVHRVAVVYPDNPWGETLARWFGKAWEAGGGEIADEITWARDAPDFTRLAKQIARLEVDALFLPSDPTNGAQLLTHLASAGVWARGEKPRFAGEKGVREPVIIGPPQWYETRFLQQAGRYAQHVLLTVPFALETARGARFDKQIQAQAKRNADAFDAFLADGVQSLVQARRIQREKGGRLLDALREVNLADGATSGLRFAARDAVPALFVLEVRDGRFHAR